MISRLIVESSRDLLTILLIFFGRRLEDVGAGGTRSIRAVGGATINSPARKNILDLNRLDSSAYISLPPTWFTKSHSGISLQLYLHLICKISDQNREVRNMVATSQRRFQ